MRKEIMRKQNKGVRHQRMMRVLVCQSRKQGDDNWHGDGQVHGWVFVSGGARS
jgi:hypothetical protein